MLGFESPRKPSGCLWDLKRFCEKKSREIIVDKASLDLWGDIEWFADGRIFLE
jgi:hypothetical protein